MAPMTLEIFLPCFFGNELSFATSKLSTALFHSAWMNQDKSFRTNVKFLMERFKNEMKISAFGVFEANLVTFVRIVNSAYSLLAILKKINS
jgi:odorant receptor